MAGQTSREVHLREYPIGVPTRNHFEVATVVVADPKPGQSLVRNVWMSVDPYMRGRMRPGPSFVPTFEIGKPLEGACVGEVVASNDGPFAVGDYVLGSFGWREYWLTDGAGATRIDSDLAPLPVWLGALGMPGLTAYVGLLRIGEIRPGETVFVSAAAGAVGSMACQIARLKGCRVVASAGSDEKVSWLRDELGVTEAFNYRKVAGVYEELERLCRGTLNVYFDNVGGEQLDAAIRLLSQHGRVVACGMISQYNSESPPSGPASLYKIIPNRLRLQGFIVFDHADMRPAFEAEMAAWIRTGQIHWKHTVIEGLENAPDAFNGLFRGSNVGKMLVRIGPDTSL